MMGNRGSIVSGVLLLGGIIMLLAIPMVSVVSAGYKTSIHDQMQTQAFYLAEAGLEHGRQAAQSLLNAYAATGNWRPSLILNTTILELNENMSTGSYWVVAEVCQSGILNTYDLLIESVGYAGQGKVGKKLSQEFSFMFVPDGKGGEAYPDIEDMALFAASRLNLEGSAKIRGDVITNATAKNSVTMGWATVIVGDLLLDQFADSDLVIDLKHRQSVTGAIATVPKTLVFPPVGVLPAPPIMVTKNNIDTSTGSRSIIADGHYGQVEVNSHALEVDTGVMGEKRILVIEELTIGGAAAAKFTVKGQGELELYVNKFTMSGSGSFNKDGAWEQVTMYYTGKDDFSIGQSEASVFQGALIVQEANIKVPGSSVLKGVIISGGKDVAVTGADKTNIGLIYAPEAHVHLNGSAGVRGAVIAENCTMGGADRYFIDYDERVADIYQKYVVRGAASDPDEINLEPGMWSAR